MAYQRDSVDYYRERQITFVLDYNQGTCCKVYYLDQYRRGTDTYDTVYDFFALDKEAQNMIIEKGEETLLQDYYIQGNSAECIGYIDQQRDGDLGIYLIYITDLGEYGMAHVSGSVVTCYDGTVSDHVRCTSAVDPLHTDDLESTITYMYESMDNYVEW